MVRRARAIDLSAITASCGVAGKFEGGECVVKPSEVAKLKPEDSCKSAPSVEVRDGKCAPTKEPPSATCGDALTDLVVKDNKCVIDRKVPRSSQGAYDGECFQVMATGADDPYRLVPGQRYEVQSQRDDKEDKVLRVVGADRKWPVLGASYFCQPRSGTIRKVPASEFNKFGAERLGWTYGMLTLPFKYDPGDKSLMCAGCLGP